jgi:hypothetical protein
VSAKKPAIAASIRVDLAVFHRIFPWASVGRKESVIDVWFPEQPTLMSSLDAMIAPRSSHAFMPRLPLLPEQVDIAPKTIEQEGRLKWVALNRLSGVRQTSLPEVFIPTYDLPAGSCVAAHGRQGDLRWG